MIAVPRWASAAIWGLTAAIPTAIVGLVLVNSKPEEDAWAIPLYSALVASWGMTGALLVTRRPDNRVGWVIWAVGIGIGLALVGQLWAYLSLLSYAGELPGTAFGAILGLLFQPALFLVMLVPMLFPDGRLTARRWALVAVLLLASAAAILVGSLMRPGPIEGMSGFDNPIGVPALAGFAQVLIDVGGTGTLVCIPAGILAAIVRYRRGTRQARTQLKWFGAVLVLAFSMFLLAVLLPQPYGQAAWIVTSSLVVVFGLGLVALQALLVGVTEGETVAVAASTLATFALFQPLRRRVQSAVDHRFDQARYDAALTAAAFAEQVRDEVHLERLIDVFVTSADRAVRPEGAVVWLPERGLR